MAAAAGLVIGVGLLRVGVTRGLTHPQAFKEFTTAPGNLATVELRDGSRLILAPATRLRVPSDFGGAGPRTVELDGEAYFAVVHDGAHPFVVRTARARVQDVGTAFTVRAYRGDPDERIAVAEGEVRVASVALRAHDLAVINAAGATQVRQGVDLAPYVGWTQGQLAFDDTPLSEAAATLERAFGIRIQFADSALAAARVTGSFASDRMDEVLTAVTEVVGARYVVNGKTVVIVRRVAPAGSGGPPPLRTARGAGHA
jgi:transmembrane sensor